MKTPLHEAAKTIGVHPSELLMQLSVLGAPFNACWPAVDEEWFETVRHLVSHDFSHQTTDATAELQTKESISEKFCETCISNNAIHVLEKLWRKKLWGDCYASPTSVSRMADLQMSDYKEAVKELDSQGFIMIYKEKHNAISLKPQMKAQIEKIMREFI